MHATAVIAISGQCCGRRSARRRTRWRSRPKRRLADEYDAAQERGEVAKKNDGDRSSKAEDLKPTITDLGLTHKDIHEARIIRDAERADPGITRRTLDTQLAAGEEPTKAAQ